MEQKNGFQYCKINVYGLNKILKNFIQHLNPQKSDEGEKVVEINVFSFKT